MALHVHRERCVGVPKAVADGTDICARLEPVGSSCVAEGAESNIIWLIDATSSENPAEYPGQIRMDLGRPDHYAEHEFPLLPCQSSDESCFRHSA
jgi:hypothetical protein